MMWPFKKKDPNPHFEGIKLTTLRLESFSTHCLSDYRWAITVSRRGIFHDGTVNIVCSPVCSPLDLIKQVSQLIQTNDVLALQRDYQWGGCDAGGVQITLEMEGITWASTVFGPQYWAADVNSGSIPPEMRITHQEEVMRFFAIWDHAIDLLQPIVVCNDGTLFRISRFTRSQRATKMPVNTKQ